MFSKHVTSLSSAYFHGELTPPFSPERYIEAFDDAKAAGAEVIVVDSGSHEWQDIGGVLGRRA